MRARNSGGHAGFAVFCVSLWLPSSLLFRRFLRVAHTHHSTMQAPGTDSDASSVFSGLENPPPAVSSDFRSPLSPSAHPLVSAPAAAAAATLTQQEEATSAHTNNTTMTQHGSNGLSSMPSSSPSTLPVIGSPRFEALQELQPLQSAAVRTAAPPADSAKCLALSSSSAPAPPQTKSQDQRRPTNGRENSQKHSNSSSSAQLDSEQGAMLLSSSPHSLLPVSRPPISSPSSLSHHEGVRGGLVAVPPPVSSAASPAASAAPPRSSSSSAASCGRIPQQAASAGAAQRHADDDQHAVNSSVNNNLDAVSSLSNPASSASASASAPAPSPTARLSASLLQLFNQCHTAATHSTSTSSSSASCSLDIRCHCLVVDDSRLAKSSQAETQYQQALLLGQPSDAQALLQHVRQWLSTEHELDAQSIAVAYAPARQPRRLHINFSSLPALAAALLACPFLVRCGSLQSASAWGSAAPCGDVEAASAS